MSFDIQEGEVHALCGENGAGKSTLMKILSGSYSFESFDGEIFVKGKGVKFRKPIESSRAGISIVYQELSLVPEMTVAENIFLGREPKRFGIVDRKKLIQESKNVLSRLGVDIFPEEKVSHLPLGSRQLVEIARAISQNPHILVLDEPTSALSKTECETLFRLIKKLRADGLGIVLVTHKLDEVFGLSDRITIFRDGRKIGTWQTSELNSDRVISLMVGREIKDFYPQTSRKLGSVALEVKNLTLPHPRFPTLNRLEHIDFSVREGEILGISGLMGSGRSELLLGIFGSLPIRGEIFMFGNKVHFKTPREAIRAGLQLVTEDRKKSGLNLAETISKNITLASLDRISNFGVIRLNRESDVATEYVRTLKVKTPSIHSYVKDLSGGNQQKVVLAKCLLSQPKVLFLDEPTRGVDVGAKSEIYQKIHELAQKGLAVVVVSSELPEVIGLCDRILVLCEGRITSEVKKENATEEKLLFAATQFRKKREVYS